MSKFKTKARTIELLGRKQIRDFVTALAELIKNSYDADAADELAIESKMAYRMIAGSELMSKSVI